MPRGIYNSQANGDAIASVEASVAAVRPDVDFGSGTLGDVVISSFVESSGEQHYESLTIQTGFALSALVREKLVVRVRNNLDIQGTGALHADGRGETGGAGAATNPVPIGSNGSVGGPGTGVRSPAAAGGGGGGGGASGPYNGGDGGNGVARSSELDGAGGGAAGAGGIGNTSGANATAITVFDAAVKARLKLGRGDHLVTPNILWGASGGGGGSGTSTTASSSGSAGVPGSQTGSDLGHGGAGGNFTLANGGGGGGAGGAGGGELEVWVGGDLLLPIGTRISANGGNGGGGGQGDGLGGDGAGGGGGAGGTVRVFYAGTPTAGADTRITATGGTGGIGATNTTRVGGNGSDGEDGFVVFLKV